MKVLLSWIRDFVDVPGTPDEIGARMSLRGLALEGIDRLGDDAVLDFDVTANRPDCLSVRGIAREIATAYRLPLRAPAEARTLAETLAQSALPSAAAEGVLAATSAREAAAGDAAHRMTKAAAAGEATSGGADSLSDAQRRSSDSASAAENDADTIPVSIEDPDLCARYVAAIADVSIGPSPAWMQQRLLASGVRPISNVVDVTNYVLLELGYPMHAFDYATLAGPAIVVRRARLGERLTTLDGKDRVLDRDMLVIADAERAQAVGGVMGGAASEVSASTRRVVFEAAWFLPPSVRATSKRLGLKTEASYRFERGADLTATGEAMARALELLEAIGAGRAAGPVVDCYPRPFEPRVLALDRTLIHRILGMEVPDEDAVLILESLGFDVRELGGWQAGAPEAALPSGQASFAWHVTAPGWRVDVQRPVDLVEEVGRHHGFEHLPSTFPVVEQPPALSDRRIARDVRVRQALVGMGMSEAITFAFIDAAAAAPFANGTSPVALANPLSEQFSTLRPSLLPGLVDAVSHNRRHGQRDVRLFEIAARFSPTRESRAVAVVWTGAAVEEHWSGGRRDVDFFDVKGVAEQIAAVMNVTLQAQPAALPYLVEGRAATLHAGDAVVGVVGQLSPAIAERREIPAGDEVYVLELDLDAIDAQAPQDTLVAVAPPRHPSVVRDIAILVDDSLSADAVRGTIRAAGPDTLVDVREFDRYQGTGIPDGKVSLALHLTFQAPDRTLTDAEVHAAMERIIARLAQDLGAVQR